MKKLNLNPFKTKKQIKVLIIEDDPTFQTILTNLLQSIESSIEIEFTTDAESTYSRLEKNTYSLVIADYFLNGTATGLDIWNFWNTQGNQNPFLIISGLEHPVFSEKAGNNPRPPYLQKPLDFGEARKLLFSLLKNII